MAESSLLGKVSNQSDIDLSIVKLISFVIIAAILSAISGVLISSINSSNLIATLISLSLFWCALVLQVFFIKDRFRLISALAVESFAMFLPVAIAFKENFSLYFFWIFLALFGMLLFSTFDGRSALGNSLKLHFLRIGRIVLSKGIPAVLIFISLVYVFMSGKDTADAAGEVISKYFLTPSINIYLPEFRYNMSLRDLIEQMTEKQNGKEEFNRLTAEQKETYIQKSESLLKSYLGDINTRQPIGSAVYSYVEKKTTDPEPLAALIVWFTIISFAWFIIKIFTLILYLPVSFLAIVLYEILIVTNFAAVEYESRSREIILLK